MISDTKKVNRILDRLESDAQLLWLILNSTGQACKPQKYAFTVVHSSRHLAEIRGFSGKRKILWIRRAGLFGCWSVGGRRCVVRCLAAGICATQENVPTSHRHCKRPFA